MYFSQMDEAHIVRGVDFNLIHMSIAIRQTIFQFQEISLSSASVCTVHIVRNLQSELARVCFIFSVTD